MFNSELLNYSRAVEQQSWFTEKWLLEHETLFEMLCKIWTFPLLDLMSAKCDYIENTWERPSVHSRLGRARSRPHGIWRGSMKGFLSLEMFEGLGYVPKVCSIYLGNQNRSKTSAVFACLRSWPSNWTGLNETCSEGERTRGQRMMYWFVSWWGSCLGTFQVFVDEFGIENNWSTLWSSNMAGWEIPYEWRFYSENH